MSKPNDDLAPRLWEALEGLAVGLQPERYRIPTVRVLLDSGNTLEVFRAERVKRAPMVAWRVRGFTDGTAVRLAAILGTRDGRALVTEHVDAGGSQTPCGGLVAEVRAGERSIADLSQAIADAVRERMGHAPS